jgi:hypothetical protein
VNVSSLAQPEKQNSDRISTDDGREIDLSDEQQQNAAGPIRESLESCSNVTSSREKHDTKHDSHKISTDDGIQIDISDLQ